MTPPRSGRAQGAALSPAARACISVALVLSVVAVPTWMMGKSRKRRRERRQVTSSEGEEDPLIESAKYGDELHIAVRDLVKSIHPKAPLVKDEASWRLFNPRKKKGSARVLPKVRVCGEVAGGGVGRGRRGGCCAGARVHTHTHAPRPPGAD